MAGNSATNTVNVIGGTTANPTIRQIKTLGETALGGQEHEDAILGANAFIYTNDGIRFTNRTSSGTTAPIVNDGSTYYIFGGNNLSFGTETLTYGVGSVAIGRNSTALNYGISLGRNNKAYNSSITIGEGLTNTDTTKRCLLGFYNSTTVNDDDKIIIGNGTNTTAHNAIVIPEHGSTEALVIEHTTGPIRLKWSNEYPLVMNGEQGLELQIMRSMKNGHINILGNSSTNYAQNGIINILQNAINGKLNIGGNSSTVQVEIGGGTTTNEPSTDPRINLGRYSDGAVISMGSHSTNTQCNIVYNTKDGHLNIGRNMYGDSTFIIGSSSTNYITPTIYTKGYRSTGQGSASSVADGDNDYLENILKDINARLGSLESSITSINNQIYLLSH